MAPKVVAIIQARMGSMRLPGKVLAEAAGKPLLGHMLQRLARCETLNEIVVATPWKKADTEICRVALKYGATTYMGSNNDVLSRVLGAARTYDADLIVELTADCPLMDPAIVDRAVTLFQTIAKVTRLIDFVSTSRDSYHDPLLAYPRGMDVRVFPQTALREVDLLAGDPVSREHVSLYFWEHRNRFHCYDVQVPKEMRSDVRLCVDTPEDLKLIKAIFEHFAPRNNFSLEEILKLLQDKPELQKINQQVEQKAVR